ncbi:hypothetical protein SCALM49S_00865 [Streptomyces californicus]
MKSAGGSAARSSGEPDPGCDPVVPACAPADPDAPAPVVPEVPDAPVVPEVPLPPLLPFGRPVLPPVAPSVLPLPPSPPVVAVPSVAPVVVAVPSVAPLVPVLPVPPVRLDSPRPSVLPPAVPEEASPPPRPSPPASPPPATTSCPGAGQELPVNEQMAARISAVSCPPMPVAISPPTRATTTRTRPRYSSAVCPPSRRGVIIRAKLNNRCSARCSGLLRNHWRLSARPSSTRTAAGITRRATPSSPAPPPSSASAPSTIHTCTARSPYQTRTPP